MPPFSRGDVEKLQIFPVEPSGIASSPWKSQDWSGSGIRAGIGTLSGRPSGGTFELAVEGDNTELGSLAYDITPANLEIALDLNPEIITDGGVSVTGVAGEYYLVEWDSNGARNLITGDGGALTPFGHVVVNRLQAGDGSNPEIQAIRIRAQLLAVETSFSAISAIAESVEVVSPGDAGSHAIQKFSFTRDAIGGTFTITFDGVTSGALNWNATVDAVQAEFDSGTYKVTGSTGGPWIIEKLSNGAVVAGSMNVTGLDALDGWEADLTISTKEAFLALAALSSTTNALSCFFEVEVTPAGGDPFTVYRDAVNLAKDILDSNVLTSLLASSGNPFAVKVGVPADSNAAGSAGQWAEDGDELYFYSEAAGKWRAIEMIEF